MSAVRTITASRLTDIADASGAVYRLEATRRQVVDIVLGERYARLSVAEIEAAKLIELDEHICTVLVIDDRGEIASVVSGGLP